MLGNFAEGDGNLVVDYGKFMRCKPVPLKGGQELVVNLRWLRQMEMVLESCGCPEDKKVMIVSRELKESVLDWWNCKKVALGTEYISRMSWSSFSKMFEAKYCTPSDVSVMEREFLTLKKDGKTVDDYVTAFYEKLQLCVHLCPDEAVTMVRFIGGLPAEYHELCKTKTNMNDVVEEARRIEDGLRIKADKHEDFGLKRKNEVNSGFRKKFKSEWCDRCRSRHTGRCTAVTLRCNKCAGFGHLYRNCPDVARCFRCKKTGHEIADCPQKAEEKKKEKHRGKAYQMIATEAESDEEVFNKVFL